MSEENALASVSPDPAPAAAPEGNTADPTTKLENVAAVAAPEDGKGSDAVTGADAEEAAKAKVSEAAKALAAARKQTAQERINELRRKAGDAERRAQKAEREAAELREKAKRPDPANIDDIAELSAAQFSYTLDQRDADRKSAEAKAASEEAEAAVVDAWVERANVFKETAPDFEELVLRASNSPMSKATQMDVIQMEEGPQIAYALTKDPAKAREFNEMSPRERAEKLGRLAERLTTTPPRRISQAPTPVDAVSGKGAQTSPFDPKKASMEEYAARRKAGWKG